MPLGTCFFKDGDLETAKLVFERALERHPGNTVAQENLAAIRKKMTEQPPGGGGLGNALNQPVLSKTNPPPAPIPRVTGPTRPEASVESAVAANLPSADLADEETRLSLNKLMDQANFFCEVGNREAALETLQEAVEVAPRDARIRSALGSLHFTQGKYETAREQFRRLIELRPRDADAYTRLAMACVKVGRIEEMEAALGLALESIRPTAKRSNFWPRPTWRTTGCAMLAGPMPLQAQPGDIELAESGALLLPRRRF